MLYYITFNNSISNSIFEDVNFLEIDIFIFLYIKITNILIDKRYPL